MRASSNLLGDPSPPTTSGQFGFTPDTYLEVSVMLLSTLPHLAPVFGSASIIISHLFIVRQSGSYAMVARKLLA